MLISEGFEESTKFVSSRKSHFEVQKTVNMSYVTKLEINLFLSKNIYVTNYCLGCVLSVSYFCSWYLFKFKS